MYFGNKLIYNSTAAVVTDRLGSVVHMDQWTTTRYFPYGDEPTATQQDRPKFATYFRDSATALDYAQQRYYASTLGRFTSPDPYLASGGPADPQSWNRYAYVQNDPVNFNDPGGLMMERIGRGVIRQHEDDIPFELWSISLPQSVVLEQKRPRGILLALSGLSKIAGGGFKSKEKCRDFFEALIKQNNLDTDIDRLMGQVMSAAGEAYSNGYVYDGARDKTPLEPDKFPGVATNQVTMLVSGSVSTTADWLCRSSMDRPSGSNRPRGQA